MEIDQGTKTRVLVVDDSAFMRTALSRMIGSDPGLQVIGCAEDGLHAIELVEQFRPDVITLDIEMPRLNGLETLKRIMKTLPTPVIMVSSLTQEGANMTFEALDAGAFDYIPKQLSYVSLDIIQIRQELVDKIKAAAKSRVVKKGLHHPEPAVPSKLAATKSSFPIPTAICIGTSTGGPKALQQILPRLPSKLPSGVLVVQHMPPGFTAPFAARLNSICSIEIKEAEPDDWVDSNRVLIAPAGWHLTIYRRTHTRFAVRLSKVPAGHLHMPSVDVMMLSAAENLKSLAMGVILTGMGNDGEAGMKAIYDAGGYTVGQDEGSCTVYGMPRACALGGTLRSVVPLARVPEEIISMTRTRVI